MLKPSKFIELLKKDLIHYKAEGDLTMVDLLIYLLAIISTPGLVNSEEDCMALLTMAKDHFYYRSEVMMEFDMEEKAIFNEANISALEQYLDTFTNSESNDDSVVLSEGHNN